MSRGKIYDAGSPGWGMPGSTLFRKECQGTKTNRMPSYLGASGDEFFVVCRYLLLKPAKLRFSGGGGGQPDLPAPQVKRVI